MVEAKFDFAVISHRRFWSLWSTVEWGYIGPGPEQPIGINQIKSNHGQC
jgi:hypothetical protein